MELLTVTVTRNPNDATLLDLDPEEITITHTDRVQWNFALEEGEFGFIHFPDERFGPFQYLQPTSQGVFAMGNRSDGTPKTHEYTALILDANGVLAHSNGGATVVNSSLTPDTSPEATVEYHPEAPNPEDRIVVTPNHLKLPLGVNAVWHISGENIDPDSFVTFRFEGDHPLTGPFARFSLMRGHDGSWFAVGADVQTPFTGHVTYHVDIRAGGGTIIVTGDPVIDLLGSPPGTLPQE